jgi:ribosomal protein L28
MVVDGISARVLVSVAALVVVGGASVRVLVSAAAFVVVGGTSVSVLVSAAAFVVVGGTSVSVLVSAAALVVVGGTSVSVLKSSAAVVMVEGAFASVDIFAVSELRVVVAAVNVVRPAVVTPAAIDVAAAGDRVPPPQLQHASVASTPSIANSAKSSSLNRVLWVLASHAPI